MQMSNTLVHVPIEKVLSYETKRNLSFTNEKLWQCQNFQTEINCQGQDHKVKYNGTNGKILIIPFES
jgi:hypothetical protein